MLLADTSAWHRSTHEFVRERWLLHLRRREIATTTPIRLEALFSARSAADYDVVRQDLDALPQLACDAVAMARAEDVQRMLAHQHALHHRSVKLIDLMIAAVAELAGVTVWHYDEDYDRIAAVTGQPTEWIAPRGSL